MSLFLVNSTPGAEEGVDWICVADDNDLGKGLNENEFAEYSKKKKIKQK